MRALRDDPHRAAAVRVKAATQLTGCTADDRVAATALLGQIGADRHNAPALRLRAMNTLATLGTPGQIQAMETLTDMLDDHTLPATSRARAAAQLAAIRPTSRTTVIRTLREIAGQAKPLHRVLVLAELGALRPDEATPLLQAVAHDPTLSPAARLLAAGKLARLRRDQYKPAAMVARELMRDERVPWHIRRNAACDLAGWSALCRQEARDLIRQLDTEHALRQ